MNFAPHGINKGKVVYFIDNRRFENTQNKRDGREKADKKADEEMREYLAKEKENGSK